MATDMKRKPSQDPSVHRDLVVTTTPMAGRDVANLRRALQARLHDARGLHEVPVPAHDKFTHAMWLACVEAGYFLGAQSATYLRTRNHRGVCTEGLQDIIRNPGKRTPEQLARARSRQGQLARGPRYYEELADKHGITRGTGIDAALRFATAQIGTVEKPAGSNWGPKIRDWITVAGYEDPVPWCGCFANAVIMAGGLPAGVGWVGYTPAIVVHAQQGIDGWKWVGPADGRRGDLALFDTPGGDPAVHVGVVEKRLSASLYRTIEGNTSSGTSGSQSEGGGVFRRERSTQGNFRIIGFARPPWS